MARFFGRKSELESLSSFYGASSQSVALVYGRRRVGKSELIKQALKAAKAKCVYYECKQTSEPNNVDSLAALVSEALGYPRLAFDSMEDLLEFLFEEAEKEGIALVLDEYPYLRDVVAGLDSVIQSIIDRHASSSGMKLVLCGSYVDVMKSLLEEENPLFGRVDLTMHLRPMDYFDSALFYPSFSDDDKVRLYSVFGGIPHYNRLVDPAKSVRDPAGCFTWTGLSVLGVQGLVWLEQAIVVGEQVFEYRVGSRVGATCGVAYGGLPGPGVAHGRGVAWSGEE